MDSIDFEKRYEREAAGADGAGGVGAGAADAVFLVLRCARDFAADTPMQVVADIFIEELCEATGRDFLDVAAGTGLKAGDFADARSRLVLVNGWQSWSFSGELRWNERPRRAILKPSLNLFADHPAEVAVRALAEEGHRSLLGSWKPDMVSHFFVVLRAGNARLALVSHNATAEGSRILPPVTFFVGSKSLKIAVFAEGGSFSAGEVVARIAIISASGYFDLKDRLSRLFDATGRFGELSFLGGNVAMREPIGGFETWYNHYLAIDEGIILRDLDALGENDNLMNVMFLKKGKPVVFQIDDGWEKRVGDWIPDAAKFPNGVAPLAGRITEKGFIPGLWVAPFLVMPESAAARERPEWLLRDSGGKPVLAGWNPGWGGDVYCLDLSLPDVEEYLVGLFDTIVNKWGFRYLKLDFLYAGMLRGAHAGLPGGHWEHYVRVLKRITSMKRAEDGRPVAWLSCGAPVESTAPLMPLMRVGADTREHWDWPLLKLIGHQGRPSAKVNIGHTLARSLLDGTLLLNDPDVIFCRTRKTTLADNEKFLIGLAGRMFASQLLMSDDPSDFGAERANAAAGGAGAANAEGAANAAGAETGGLSEPEFTRELLDLFEELGNREFGVERYSLSSPDIYRFFSRDGELHGIVNLSDRTQALEAESPSGESAPAIAPAHAMVLFGLPRT
ncbi:MAG: glycoside hydrolase family 36 protein [Candidatus Hydrogenedentales bacterium]